jgi:hypothetical protein
MATDTFLPALKAAAAHTITRWWFALTLFIAGASFVLSFIDPLLPLLGGVLVGIMIGYFLLRFLIAHAALVHKDSHE